MALPEAHSVVTVIRASKRRTSSSSTNTAPAQGALNAVASPAPAPAARSALASSWSRPKAVARKCPMPAPIWTVGPSRQHASKEFHWDQNQRRRRLLVTQHRLNVRDAAPLCSWREFSDKPGSQPRSDGRKTDNERQTTNLLSKRPIDNSAPEAIGLLEDEPKDASYKA